MQALEKIDNIYCGPGIWTVLNSYLEEADPSKIFVLTDSNTRKHCLPLLRDSLEATFEFTVLEMSHGELHKNISTCVTLWEELSKQGADRNSILINLGGGVVTDLGGFVGATFKRGIPYINIATSLLGMVDAAVGGKNGVDLGVLKNQIGVIKNPELVLIDTSFLKTLPENHARSGLAEMIKHGIIHSKAYYDEVMAAKLDSAEFEKLIWESIKIKHQIVLKDPNEQGLRKSLNFGHTLGHAIESYCLKHAAKENLLHGEAIAIGMILETYLSSRLLHFSNTDLDTIASEIVSKFGKVRFNKSDIEAIISLLIFDKKNRNGNVYFVLLREFGKIEINQKASNDLIYSAFEYYSNC